MWYTLIFVFFAIRSGSLPVMRDVVVRLGHAKLGYERMLSSRPIWNVTTRVMSA